MEVILLALIIVLLNGAVAFIDELLNAIVPITLYADKYMGSISSSGNISLLFDIMLGFGVSLIILKFLKKGFECYVLWTDGDPDVEPFALVIRFIQAIAVAVCFPVLYDWFAKIIESLINDMLITAGIATNFEWDVWISTVSSLGLVAAIFGLIFIICYIVLYFQFLMRGLEILILRIGVPLACVGLLDNDKGIFKLYINKFFQNMVAVVVQLSLCKFGIGLMLDIGVNINVFWGLSCMFLAVKTPRFLNEFIVPLTSGGGAAINNLYHSVKLVQMVKGIKK